MKLEPDGVVAELAARQSGPLDGVLAFLDVLLRFAPLIVEPCHPLGGTGQVGDDDDQPDLSGPPFMRESGVVASPYVVAGVQRKSAHWCLARSLPVPVVCKVRGQVGMVRPEGLLDNGPAPAGLFFQPAGRVSPIALRCLYQVGAP